MPFVKIDMWEGRDKEAKKKLIQAVSRAVAESLGISIDWVHVVINDVPKDNWGLKGEQASEIRK